MPRCFSHNRSHSKRPANGLRRKSNLTQLVSLRRHNLGPRLVACLCPFKRATDTITYIPVTRDDFDYAIENTRVIVAPERQIATFGSTSFNFYLISELMDRVNQVRIRNGKIQAERPQILTPEHYCRLLLEGFGDKAERYVDQLREHARNIAVLRYGFQFRKTDLNEQTFSESIDAVINRTRQQVENKNEPLSAIIQGVDDAWEVCLLKFTIDLVERSSGGNLGDFRKRGLI